MRQMLHFDPAKRPSAVDCLHHKFFHVRVPIPMNAPGAYDLEASQLLEDLDLNASIDGASFGVEMFKKSMRDRNDKQRQQMIK